MTSSPASVPRDAGLAGERTDLSWGRTLLAVMVLASLFLKWLPSHGPVSLVPMGMAVVSAIGLALLRRRRRREVLSGQGTAAEEVVGLTALVLAVGVAALILIA